METTSSASKKYELKAELLIDVLSTFKTEFKAGISEFSLITHLKQPPHSLFDDKALRDPLLLFKTHFVLFHALYRLREKWQADNTGYLDIHALNIQLQEPSQPYSESSHHGQTSNSAATYDVGEHDALSAYYLDWRNFEETQRGDVDALLDEFWHKMQQGGAKTYSHLEVDNAHATLNMTQSDKVSLILLKKHYKKTLHHTHPDKGGSQEEAQTVINAYHLLLNYYSFS